MPWMIFLRVHNKGTDALPCMLFLALGHSRGTEQTMLSPCIPHTYCMSTGDRRATVYAPYRSRDVLGGQVQGSSGRDRQSSKARDLSRSLGGGGGGVGGGEGDEEWCDDDEELAAERLREEDAFVQEEDPLDTAWGDVWCVLLCHDDPLDAARGD
eukprot:1159940-Pelagomonas_calceolata.AAC.3